MYVFLDQTLLTSKRWLQFNIEPKRCINLIPKRCIS